MKKLTSKFRKFQIQVGHGNPDAGQENPETGQENETADQSEREEEHDQEPTKLEYPLTNIFIGMIVPEEVT